MTHLLKKYILTILKFTKPWAEYKETLMTHIYRWKTIQVVKQVVKVDIIKEC